MHKESVKIEAVRLRKEEQKTLSEISDILKISKGTASLWLRDIKIRKLSKKRGRYKDRGNQSSLSKQFDANSLSRTQKGNVAESAVQLRLQLKGFSVFSSSFDGERTDWIAESSSSKILYKIQVKWLKEPKCGLPFINLTSQDKMYDKSEVDFFIGYDFYTDSCYVFPYEDVVGKKTKTVESKYLESWDLII